MMKIIKYLILLPLVIVSCAQTTNVTLAPPISPTATPRPTIAPTATLPPPACENFNISSEKVRGNIEIEIALPEGYGSSGNSAYTSIYLLDANYFFDEFEGSLDYLLERGEGMINIVQSLSGEGKIPPSLLIGIGYSETNRSNYTQIDIENFYAFFAEELIPEIEARCDVGQTGSDRVLFGYSSSAHFSTYVLLYDVYTNTETFSKFISISGVYDKTQKVSKFEEQLFEELGATSFDDRSLFMAIGADDPKSELADAHSAFAGLLTSRGYRDFNLYITEFPELGHYDIPEFAFSEGLIWVFSE